jgi:hypothetical protein
VPIVGGLDIHRKQLTFDYLDTVTGEMSRGRGRAVARVGRQLGAEAVPEGADPWQLLAPPRS